jgi:hypothetical protein
MNGDNQMNIGDLLKQLKDDTTALVREEVALAKTEASEKLSYFGRNAGYIAAGGVVALSGLIIVLMAFGYLLADLFAARGMSPGIASFLGFLIVAVVVAIAGGGLITKGIKAFKDEPVTPTRTVQSLREDRQWAQNKVS